MLAEMGLNVRDPELGGLNGATTRNGVDYLLVFDSEDLAGDHDLHRLRRDE